MHGSVFLAEKGEVLRPAICGVTNVPRECEEITQIVGEEKLMSITVT
jgi:sugar (pentulose or hexulose) kinase